MPEEVLAEMTRFERAPRWQAALARDSEQRVWIAERDGRGLGFLAWGPARDADLDRGTAELNSLYVDEEAAGSGLAARLMDQALREMGEVPYRRSVLWVLENNARARRFYERSGWAADGARKVIREWGGELPSVRYAIALR
jgi:GNAT superfamily N-acetyltransferase